MRRLLMPFAIIASMLIAVSCASPHTQNKKSTTVHCYHSEADFLWYYLINTNNGYYYYSSASPVATFNQTINWTYSATQPAQVAGLPEQPSVEVDMATLEPEVAQDVEVDAVETASELEPEVDFEVDVDADGGYDGGGYDGSSDGGGGDGGGGGGD